MTTQSTKKAVVSFVKATDGLKIDFKTNTYFLHGTVAFEGLEAVGDTKTSKFLHPFTQVQRRVPFNTGTLAAGKYSVSGRVKENGELDITIKNLSGTVVTAFTCDEPTSMGVGTFSGLMDSPPKLGLGPVSHYSDYSTDLVSGILQGARGGSNTQDYFTKINNMGQLFQQLADNGRSAWNDAQDDGIGLPMKYIAYTDADNKQYYITIRQDEVQQDGNGNVVFNGSTATVKGVNYNGIGMITMTCGYEDFAFSKTSWWLGLGLAGSVPVQAVWAALGDTIKSVAGNVADKIKSMFDSGAGAEGGEEAEDAIEEADTSADSSIEAEVGEVAVEEAAEEGAALGLGEIFIGAALVLAIVFIILSFVFHNTYHSLRVWNLTKYTLDWTIHFDSSEPEAQGQLVTGPVVFSGSNITKFIQFLPVKHAAPVPGAKPVNSCHYGDLHVNSSHEYSGIGYVLQFSLKDDNGNEQYKATTYFDLPLSGSNSTNVSLDSGITNLQNFYEQYSGNNKETEASVTSNDGKITFSTTYDYLTGQHVVPNSGNTGNSNEAYYYQSVLTLVQNDLSPSSAATLPVTTKKFVPVERAHGKASVFKHINPAYHKHVINYFKNRKATAATPATK